MYPFLVENMADEEAHIQNLNIEVNSKEVCYFMCGEKFGRILFEIFCGYKKPKTGEIFVCNKDWLDLDENSRSLLNRRLFGIAAEEFPLIEFMTVEENISMPSLLDGDKSNIEELVKAFDIGHLLQKYPSDLNHREKMRCICARAFSGGRKVVVIFDLFKRMQEQSKAELAILTYHAAKSLGIAALYISEDLDENYGAYDLIYKYRPEKKEFSIIDYRA